MSNQQLPIAMVNGNMGRTIEGCNIIVNCPPSSEVKFVYELHTPERQSFSRFSITPRTSFLQGRDCLIIPQISHDQINSVSFKWIGYNNPISSNIGPVQQDILMHVTPIKNLDEVFFVGGDYTESYIDHKNDTRSKIIIAGDTKMIDQEQLVSYVDRMSQAHYKFFEDINYINDYFVTTKPV